MAIPGPATLIAATTIRAAPANLQCVLGKTLLMMLFISPVPLPLIALMAYTQYPQKGDLYTPNWRIGTPDCANTDQRGAGVDVGVATTDK